jgi:hypothetical protein
MGHLVLGFVRPSGRLAAAAFLATLILAFSAEANAEPTPAPSPGVPASASPTLASPVPLQPAGTVPGDLDLELGGIVGIDFANAQIAAAVTRAAALQPGATVSVSGLTIAGPLQPGTLLESYVDVHLSGHGAYADVDGTASLHLRVDSLAPLDPSVLFYSDDPETVDPGVEGVLFRDVLNPEAAARLYAYHVAAAPQTRLYLALETSAPNARVQFLGDAAGPAGAYGYVGHVVTLRYLLERSTQESVVFPMASGAPLLIPLGSASAGPNALTAAIFDLRVLDGGPVEVMVVAAAAQTDPVALLAAAELPGDGHGRRGRFSIANVAPLTLAFTSGGPEPEPFSAGLNALDNLRPGARPLRGDYGIVRDLALQLANPSPTPQTVYLYEAPQAGAVTTTLWFAGDPQPTEIPCVRVAGARYAVKQFDLSPGQNEVVRGEYMTDGASSYPLLFGLTATPPSPPPDPASPEGCLARPAASPMPNPSPSTTPSPSP